MKLKKLLAAVLTAAVMASACTGIVMGAEPVASEEPSPADVSITKKTVPCYLRALDTSFDLSLYFVEDAPDLPYVDLKEWADVMVTCYQAVLGATGYELYMETDGPVFQYTRENGYKMLFDFEKGTISSDDYDGFLHKPGDTSLLDMVSMNSFGEDPEYPLLQRIEKGSFDRYGKAIEINLTDYNIPMCYAAQEALYMVPLQTLRDLLLAIPMSVHTYYNGEAVYIALQNDLINGEELSDLGQAYYSAAQGSMSGELARYSYFELCMALDHLYGLKESHDIRNFDDTFIETGYKDALSSTDPNVVDGALNDFIHYYLDDLHSSFKMRSYLTTEVASQNGQGLSALRDSKTGALYDSARAAADHAIPPYEEIGNTAYITFDHFTVTGVPQNYYDGSIGIEDDPSSGTLDTIALMIYAHRQITREGSPVENVVIDLSLNGGGDIDAAAFVAAWYLGEASISIRDSLTGAVSTGTYRVDVNLDGVFDEKDTLRGKKLYCLISPYSFSCGNLVPSIFKSSREVTLLGRESGGGSCLVLPMTTAYGASFQISSPDHMAYVKNGSYYDIDTGIEPDSVILKPENFYDRTKLTEHINQLY